MTETDLVGDSSKVHTTSELLIVIRHRSLGPGSWTQAEYNKIKIHTIFKAANDKVH